jgi:dTMP kinase
MGTPDHVPPGAARALFVVLEGIDGAGKSEQARRLAAWLRERGDREVVETREPTSGEWGLRYRAWARGEIEATPDEVLELFARDRREHVETLIRPALERGATIVCDRYVYSSLAYQAAHGVDRGRLVERLGVATLPKPDLVLWLRLPVSCAMERLGSAAHERFERQDFLERVDAEYAALGLESVDASADAERVAEAIRARVAPLLD